MSGDLWPRLKPVLRWDRWLTFDQLCQALGTVDRHHVRDLLRERTHAADVIWDCLVSYRLSPQADTPPNAWVFRGAPQPLCPVQQYHRVLRVDDRVYFWDQGLVGLGTIAAPVAIVPEDEHLPPEALRAPRRHVEVSIQHRFQPPRPVSGVEDWPLFRYERGVNFPIDAGQESMLL